MAEAGKAPRRTALPGGWSAEATHTILEFFEAQLKANPDKRFLDFQGDEWSYARLDRASTSLAHGLRALGVKKGDTVTSLLDNGPAPTVLMFALFKLGAIHVGVNTAYKGAFLRHQIEDSAAAIVVAESDYAGRVLSVEGGLTKLKHLLYRGAAPAQKPARISLAPFDSVFSGEETMPLGAEVQPSDLAVLVYTGGTTGPSKGCMISHNYACSLAKQCLGLAEYGPDEVLWTPLPNFHFNLLASSIFMMMMIGGVVSIYPRFSLSNFWPEIRRSGATRASLMGAMMPLIAQQADSADSKACYGQLRSVTGAPFSPEAQRIWRERFGTHKNASAFGLTECCLIVNISAGMDYPPTAVGMRNANFDVRIFDDQDRELPPGAPGEIVVRPLKPHVMFEGYWGRPKETLALWRNGWFHTGDVGRFDENGFMYFVDRKKDYMRRRGENISSFEMDQTFRNHPAIEDVAVHAVLSELGEDDVKVTCVLRPGHSLTEEQLCRWAIENVPYFAVPRYYEFRAEIPRSVLGRVLKYQLRDEGVTAATFDLEKAGIKYAKR